jgi:glycosyltransferase involved in cell wall biosynthesis
VKPTALVVTTVHRPDDTRVRERLLRSLTADFQIRYAARRPGPSDPSDLEWVPLGGRRIRRNLAALRICLFTRWDLLVVHDPELLPAAMLSRLTRRRPVVFDVHENIPATALTRSWVPTRLRRPLSAVLGRALHLAERILTITLAEPGYEVLFRRDHVVFPNYPDTAAYPGPEPGARRVVYLGDVTEERGATVAVEACALAGVPLTFVGRAPQELRERLGELASDRDSVRFTGELPNPAALEEARGAGVGISPLLDIPNYRESAPTKILEYLAVGLPVVASDLPGTRRLVEGLEAVELVAPGDVGETAGAIERCLEPAVRSAAARQIPEVRDRYRWPGAEVAAFYRELV